MTNKDEIQPEMILEEVAVDKSLDECYRLYQILMKAEKLLETIRQRKGRKTK